MTDNTSLADINGIAVCGSGPKQTIADISEMIFKLEGDSRTERICDMLLFAVSRLETVNTERLNSVGGQVKLMKALDGLSETENELARTRIMLDTALSELYKHGAMLECMKARLEECTQQLLDAETELYGILEKIGDNADAVRLGERRRKDIAASKLLAANCISVIGRKYTEARTLADGINSLAVSTIPLWRAQLADARRRGAVEDINRSIDTGSAFAATVRETIRKVRAKADKAVGNALRGKL